MRIMLAAVVTAAALAGSVLSAAAQTTEHARTLFAFTQRTGEDPDGGIVIGRHGAIFGTTTIGGIGSCTAGLGCGTVFALDPPASPGLSWTEQTLYDFQGGQDGSFPTAPLAVAPDGTLFGYDEGGTPGTVFSLTPPAAAGNDWTFRILHVFNGGSDGSLGTYAPLVATGGVLFGIATGGDKSCGTTQCGSVFELMPDPGSTAWRLTTVFRFAGGATSGQPSWIVGPDRAGKLYVATSLGLGAVVELSPPADGGPWKETVLTTFAGGSDGARPTDLVLAADDTIYGLNGRGVFQLTPPTSAAGWTRTTIASVLDHGYGPNSLALGRSGTLIGAIYGDQDFYAGSIFQLTPPAAGNDWTVSFPWKFSRGPASNPINAVIGRGGFIYSVLWDTYSPGAVAQIY